VRTTAYYTSPAAKPIKLASISWRRRASAALLAYHGSGRKVKEEGRKEENSCAAARTRIKRRAFRAQQRLRRYAHEKLPGAATGGRHLGFGGGAKATIPRTPLSFRTAAQRTRATMPRHLQYRQRILRAIYSLFSLVLGVPRRALQKKTRDLSRYLLQQGLPCAAALRAALPLAPELPASLAVRKTSPSTTNTPHAHCCHDLTKHAALHPTRSPAGLLPHAGDYRLAHAWRL